MQRPVSCGHSTMLSFRIASSYGNTARSVMGFSITELMVACALSGLLVSIVASYSARSHISLSSLQHATSVEEDMRALKSTISQHLSRAGFVQTPNVLSSFLALSSGNIGVVNVTLGQHSTESPNSCITFSYDKNKNGVISQPQGELFGYRLHNKAIEYRVNGKTCEQGGWFDLTDTDTVLATLFSVNRIQQSSWGAAYEIQITLQSAIDTNIQSHESFIVEVSNEG